MKKRLLTEPDGVLPASVLNSSEPHALVEANLAKR